MEKPSLSNYPDSLFIIVITIAFCTILSLLAILLYHLHTLRIIHRLENMIDSAIDGSFIERSFDESRLSALENRFAKYLSAAETSYRNIATERNNIKELISDISHQTKTPVANILLYGELLKEQDLPETADQYVTSMTMQAEKLNFLISSLVKLSRLEAGIFALSPKRTPVFPMLEKLVVQYAPLAEEKKLTLSLKQMEEENEHPAAVFDEKWTAEAVGNLIDNAIKYTEKGSVTLSVSLYEMYLCIQIADTGIGVLEQEHAKIFSRFYRSEAVHDQAGIGIGLFLAREIITLEGGYIKICSKPGKGSVFSVFLSL